MRVSSRILYCGHSTQYSHLVIMAAEDKAIIFYRCNVFLFYFVSIDERPAMGSEPNLTSRSKVVSI